MVLWFVGTAVLAVWFVFRDERFDYRWLAFGVLVPDVVDGPTGGAWVMHSVVTASVLLCAVMLLTRGRRHLRKAMLAAPIGVFLHLVFDGAFSSARSFWWPLTGPGSDGWTGWFGSPGEPLPVVERGLFNVVLEIAGLVMLIWIWRYFGLAARAARRALLREGRLSRPVAGPAGTC